MHETDSMSQQRPDYSCKVTRRGYGDVSICEEKLFTSSSISRSSDYALQVEAVMSSHFYTILVGWPIIFHGCPQPPVLHVKTTSQSRQIKY